MIYKLIGASLRSLTFYHTCHNFNISGYPKPLSKYRQNQFIQSKYFAWNQTSTYPETTIVFTHTHHILFLPQQLQIDVVKILGFILGPWVYNKKLLATHVIQKISRVDFILPTHIYISYYRVHTVWVSFTNPIFYSCGLQ